MVYQCDAEQTALFYMSRTPTVTKTWISKMDSIVKAKLPHADISTLMMDVQGDKCSYKALKGELEFLQ